LAENFKNSGKEVYSHEPDMNLSERVRPNLEYPSNGIFYKYILFGIIFDVN